MAQRFRVSRTWRMVLHDLGVSEDAVLRRTALSARTFRAPGAWVSPQDYFALWEALDAEAEDPGLALRIGRRIPLEGLDLPLFGALCSPDLTTAVERLSRFKQLVGPLTLTVRRQRWETVLEVDGSGLGRLPALLGLTELVFLTVFARAGTRARIRPVRVTAPEPPDDPGYAAFFGVGVAAGDAYAVAFTTADAHRPFLTEDAAAWELLEPQLRRSLADATAHASTAESVRAVLVELLPGGRGTVEGAARALGTSPRSLQRRLRAEDTSFQECLRSTREHLARYYLGAGDLTGAEIGLLLGYRDPNSFFRAFRSWTGQPPEAVRAALRGGTARGAGSGAATADVGAASGAATADAGTGTGTG